MNIKEAFGIWLNSKTKINFKQWLKKHSLTFTNSRVLVLLSFQNIYIIKERLNGNEDLYCK